MTMTTQSTLQGRANAHYHRAWWSFALFVPALVGAFVVGEGLVSLYGYSSSDESVPLLVPLAAGLPAILVFALPAIPIAVFARRARREGRGQAWIPLALGVGVPAVFVAQNLLAFVVGLVAG